MSDNSEKYSDYLAALKQWSYELPSFSEAADRIGYQPLLNEIGDARVVLIGECTHGTSDFYKERQKITKWLIEEKDFTVLAVEADWLEAQRCHSYIRGMDGIDSAEDALSSFKEFPSWTWRNEDVKNFLEWLREHNMKIIQREEANGTKDQLPHKIVGFYGLDIYSMHASLLEVKRYLEEHHPSLAQQIVQRYDEMADRGRGHLTEENPELRGLPDSELVDQLIKLLEEAGQSLLSRINDGDNLCQAIDLHFFAQQNSRVMKRARDYCRALLKGGQLAWNVREEHMFEACMALIEHLQNTRPLAFNKPLKTVVWAHNVHVGDARGMEMGWKGALSLGQLFRTHSGLSSFSVGFSTFQGTLTTADEWGGEAKVFDLLPAEAGSYEEIFHSVNLARFIVHLTSTPFKDPNLLQREIGTLYRPKKEHSYHYFHAILSHQFDAIIHIDHTNAVQPLV